MRAESYQIEGAQFLLSAMTDRSTPPSRLLLDEPGTGKTVQASLLLAQVDRPAIVCCNAGMRRSWQRHLLAWCPGRPIEAVESEVQARQRAEALAAGAGPSVLVMSHENLAASVRGLGSPVRRLLRSRAGVLVLDEAHLCKSATSNRGHGLRDAVDAAHAGGGMAAALTATPMPRDPIDLWVLLRWLRLDEWCFPGGLHQFAVEHFGGVPIGGRWRFPARPPGGTLRGRFCEVAMRRLRRDVLPGLPEKAREVRVVAVEGAAAAMLDRAARAVAQAAGLPPDDLGRDDAGDRAVELSLEIGRRLEDLTELRVAMAEAKVPALLAWVAELEAAGTPTAVYSDHLAPIEALSARPGWVTIRGEDSDRARDAAVAAFEARAADPATGTPIDGIGYTGAGRVGISLNRAEVLVVASTSWAHASEEQAADRVLRYGKLVAPTIGHLVLGHPLEVFMHKVLAAKRTRSEVALEGCTRRPASVALPSVTPESTPAETPPPLPRDRRPWMSHKRLTTRRDCGFAYHARYDLRVGPPQPFESRRLGILFAGAIAGRLVVWARDPAAAAGAEGDEAARAEVKKEAKQNEWPQKIGRTEDDGVTAVELSRRAMERFGFFSGRWEPYLFEGKPAVEVELRAPLVPADFPFPTAEARALAEQMLTGWAGFYGRCDLIAYDREHRGGTGKPRLRVVDFKCKERMSEGLSDGADDIQLMLYLYAARALGIPADLATRIEVRNALPSEPPLVNSGKKLSVDKGNVTDAQLFEAAVKRYGFDRSKYAEHIDWLAREGPRCYSLVECGRTTAALEQVWREMLWDASEMLTPRPVRNLRAYASSPCHSDRFRCEYKELCTATLPGLPTPEGYAKDLVRIGSLKPTSWRGPKSDAVGAFASTEQAPQEH